MKDIQIFKNNSEKPFETFIKDITEAIEKEDFRIIHRDKSNLMEFYKGEGIDLPKDYQHVILQICNPESSGKSIPINPERSVFVQKYIFVYNKGDKTEIRFLGYSAELIGDLLGHNEFEKGSSDDFFAERMEKIYSTMGKIIQSVV